MEKRIAPVSIRRESDLYQPVKAFLEMQGYAVRAEVQDCDIMAVQGEMLVVVELKQAFSLNLVLQGIDRQTMTDHVYLAVAAPQSRGKAAHWSAHRRLCGRLGLGLLHVHFSKSGSPWVEVIRDCEVSEPRRNKRKVLRLKKEFERRSGDFNIGGAARGAKHSARPVVTAYREEALRIAQYLQGHGPSRLKDIRGDLGLTKADSILTRNFYGWFTRVERGIYGITDTGATDLALYSDVVAEQTVTYMADTGEEATVKDGT